MELLKPAQPALVDADARVHSRYLRMVLHASLVNDTNSRKLLTRSLCYGFVPGLGVFALKTQRPVWLLVGPYLVLREVGAASAFFSCVALRELMPPSSGLLLEPAAALRTPGFRTPSQSHHWKKGVFASCVFLLEKGTLSVELCC